MGIFNFLKKKDGLVKSWHSNGQLWTEYNYKDGEKDGLSKTWMANGQLEAESNYKNGKVDGLSKVWHSNGQLRFEANYKDGELDGLSKTWDENGQLKTEANYKDGKQAHLRGSEVSALKAEEKAELITPLIAYCSSVAIALFYISAMTDIQLTKDFASVIGGAIGVLLLPAVIAFFITLFSTIKFHTAFFWVTVILIPLSALGTLSA